MRDLEFLIWLHHRLTEVHGEDRNFDYMHKLRSIMATIPPSQVTPNTSAKSITDLTVDLYAAKRLERK